MRQLLPILSVIALTIGSSAGQTPAKGNRGGTVYVLTHIDVTPNWVPDTVKAMQQLEADSKKDPGFMRFEIMQQDARPNHLVILEVWESRQAYEAHAGQPHTRQFREKMQPMLGSPFDVRLHDLLP
jgi:quinol monooxygenase YgiN